MGSWSNFGVSISRNSSTGVVTITCSASITAGYQATPFVVRQDTHGEARAYVTGEGDKSWAADASGDVHWGAFSGNQTFYLREKTATGVYADCGSHKFPWSIDAATFTVTFNANGGVTPTPSKSVSYGSTYGTLPTPTKSGYAFLGWFTAQTGGTQVTSSTTVSITANQVLWAHWEAQSILHVSNEAGVNTITEIYAVDEDGVHTIIGCYAVDEDGVHQGV